MTRTSWPAITVFRINNFACPARKYSMTRWLAESHLTVTLQACSLLMASSNQATWSPSFWHHPNLVYNVIGRSTKRLKHNSFQSTVRRCDAVRQWCDNNPNTLPIAIRKRASVQLKTVASIWRPKSAISEGIFSNLAA